MEFHNGDKSIRFQGDPHLSEAKISKSGLRKLMANGDIAYFYHLQRDAYSTTESKTRPELVVVVKEFEDILAEP